MNQMQDELDRLSNPEAAKAAEKTRNRSNFRAPFTAIKCDIDGVVGPYDSTLNNGEVVQRVALQLSNIVVHEAVTTFTERNYDLEIGLPKNPNLHSELVQMVMSAEAIDPKINSIRRFAGLKGVELVEEVHDYPGRKPTSRYDSAGKQIWEDAEMHTYFYAVKAIGFAGGSSNGNGPAAAPAVSEERLNEALTLIDGLTSEEASAQLGADFGDVLSTLLVKRLITQGADGKYAKV